MIDYTPLYAALQHIPELRPWLAQLPAQVAEGLSPHRWGDLPDWHAALRALPDIAPSTIDVQCAVSIGSAEDASPEQLAELEQQLRKLHPWRKGPWEVFGLTIDTEWRSDWKWDRVLPHLAPLKDHLVLDVGCGNGYHCWRSFGAGARRVIGIDPSAKYVAQFYALKKYLGEDQPVDLLPLGIEALPPRLRAFDTTFSMGVLYHRRSPMDHLRELRETLRPGGQLILETLVIEGELGECLVPEGRYAKMRNVWFIPSCATLESWLRKCGFENPRTVNLNTTSIEEQRRTDWMHFESLADFLDPKSPHKTIEGHPAPLRAVVVANAT
ncbi:tRNA 5-methoxyuridine(34)/uridine 5-oxyacetic acid(34) synthase CmoB [Microbulbifer thermotolerans]|uniref:tRNA U34 carboxymethyltransferase n=1 Tax=Microbulbifer thermotolerans TaxID=252514 RepID=A0A143HL25_MICTH|nr:tRNA 5-methoxyuridine(34)/uridine 5-oxyacetic acid(34) synthase CmoB [Microbulbifer thermotolerans]AMX02425.1 tRNA (mo5U34)-methyltransferase [Microbulbifer thermotolerans]MCX2784570.1 tRNA 5-methoxyuridine(34)/uridine 5-oxyacetic acid(34) synthase CmoB [Microbulbifer thermotolerans]MCX2795224.1 tRNA 5-methoxyuridine(34)/uridine 5-oxyacetic acid(34) synthase CmoB [Microbulbifer thermotolerans]MCX2802845.1 tRNA 5-methoxyuridine(34)/uridine 5-oxyacetic acid(34) synthase CmoB [Microbulbifer the